ncbi:MAG: ATP-dependent DNA helicase RecG [Solirubrobacteraceae bacterium]
MEAGPSAWADAPVRWPRPSRWTASSGFTGKKALAAAEHLGIDTVGGLLQHLPVETGGVATIATLRPDERQTVIVAVERIRSRPVRRRGMRPLVEALVSDGTGRLQVAFFNQPWLAERYPPGTRVMLSGTLKGPGRFSVSAHAPTNDPVGGVTDRSSPAVVPPSPTGPAPADGGPGSTDHGDAAPAADATADGQARPIEGGDGTPPLDPDVVTDDARPGAGGPVVARYPTTDGLTSIEIYARVRELEDHLYDAIDPLPARLRAREGLPDRTAALRAAHLGDHERGRRRLAFDELLAVQMEYLRRRRRHGGGHRAIALDGPATLTDRWVTETLPFALTGDQRRAIGANLQTLATGRPLQRLLMGEVGSGKTVVALHAMLRAVECGHQAALMAPTETLAEQHFRTIQRLLPDALVPVDLLTGSTPVARRRPLLQRLADGQLPLVVGTHALIEDAVAFRSLAVAVVDEQHRFGVRQRCALDRKAAASAVDDGPPPDRGARGEAGPGEGDTADGRGPGAMPDGGGAGAALVPHVLHMTATPIPRTMALLHYGDLDVATLRELPGGRRPIVTHVCSSDRERARAYARIREEVAAGRQAFVVCPLVEDSDTLDARSATSEYERLRTGELQDLRVALLHGQMRPAEKQDAMERFAAGDADVLVATTVIEVGIDVPNATVMVVENAERFGISQLHQLRGRVGRGEHASLCLLFGPKNAARLRALAAHTDGFALSEVDLALRGEGELLGTRQSGVARFHVARMPDDADLLLRAREVAERLEADDPELDDPIHVPLRDALDEARALAPDEDEGIPA